MKYFNLLFAIIFLLSFSTILPAATNLYKHKTIDLCWVYKTQFDEGSVKTRLLNMGDERFSLNGESHSDYYNETYPMTGSASLKDGELHIVAVVSHFNEDHAETSTLYILADENLDAEVRTISIRAGLDWYHNPEYDFGTLSPVSCDSMM